MSKHYFFHEVEILNDKESTYAYVTNTNKWHEWFPSAQPLTKKFENFKVGNSFQMTTIQRPIKFLPFSLTKTLNYTVAKSEPSDMCVVEVDSELIDATITYTLKESHKGTIFKREFQYTPKKWLKILDPIWSGKNMIFQAGLGINNLKAKVEAQK